MQHGRKLIGGVLALAITGGAAVFAASSADAKPSVEDAKAKVNKLYHEAEVASERYDASRIRLQKLKTELKNLQADQGRQDQQLSGVRDQLRAAMLRRFEGSSLSAVSQVMVSDNPASFLESLSTMTAYDGIQASLLASYDAQVKELNLRKAAVTKRLAAVAALEAQQKKDKVEYADKLEQAQHVLASLQVSAREAVVSRDAERVDISTADVPPASGAAAVAIQAGMTQLGKPYAYGAAGPDAYDCSGFTMWSYAHAGIALPHSSSAQYYSGPHVAVSDLEPGDLVFYYSPISHVGIYIGNGLIINSENPSTGVRIQGLYSMPYVGAVRPS